MKYFSPRKLLRVIFLALCLTLSSSAPALAQQAKQPNKDDERTSPAVVKVFREVVAKPSESAVRILCNGKEAALGAIVDANGLILTKSSLLIGDITCKLKDGRVFTAEVLGEHDGCDLALLKIPAKGLVPVKWRPSKELKQAMWLASVAPSADPLAIGVVGVVTRTYKDGDQPLGPGPKSGYLGVVLENTEKGARITTLMAKGPALKAGLKVDDIIIQAGTRPVTTVKSLQSAVSRHKPGEVILVKVLRGEETLDIKTTLGEPPALNLGNPQDQLGSDLSNRRGGFESVLQHDSIIKPHDCGGPVVDLDGNTVGINIARAGRTETYAIPSEAVLALLGDLKSGKLRVVHLSTEPPFKVIETLLANGKLTDKSPLDKVRTKSFHHVETVNFKAGAEYTIELKSSDFDPFLRLEDPAGEKLAEDDDGAGDFNAKIVFRAPVDGEYRIVVTTFNEGETGAYTLIVRQTSTPKK
jgi:serine protease Do